MFFQTLNDNQRAREDGLKIVVGHASDIGEVRLANEDAVVVVPEVEPRLVVVADGMGGHRDGGLASRIAVESITRSFRAGPVDAEALGEAIQEANAAVRSAGKGHGTGRRMGTTCTALLLTPTEVVVGHVGDSRVYHVGPEALELLSTDHTVAAALQERGFLSPEDAQRHPHRHALTRALGSADRVEVEIVRLGPPRAGSRFVVCSDGLGPVPLEEVWQTAANVEPQEAAELLIRRANALGGPDNISVAIVEVRSAP